MNIVRSLGAAVAAASIIAIAGFSAAQAQTKVTVGKVVGGVGLHIPSYIAMDKGFFKEEGLDARFVELAGRPLMTAGLSGNVDFVPIPSGGAQAVLKGAKLKYIVGQSLKPQWIIVTKPEIKKVEDIKGKVLGYARVGAADYDEGATTLDRFFNLKVGRDYKVIQFQGEPERIAAMANGDVSGALVSVPRAYQARQAGFTVLLRTGDYLPRAGGAFWCTEDYFRKNPEAVVKFIVGFKEATDWGGRNTARVAEILQKVANTTPPQNIKKAKVVRDALTKLAFSAGPVAQIVDVSKFMEDPATSSYPATMAKQFIAKAPNVTAVALENLTKAPTIDPQASTATRLADLVTGSAAGKGPDRPPVPGYVSPEDRADQMKDTLAAMRGGKAPTTYGPGSVDILQVIRLGQGFKSALKPQAVKPAAPKSEDYPAVTAAIAKMPKDALVPAEAKGKGDPDEWASTAEFASDLARRMDIAQKSGQTEITVDLGWKMRGRLRQPRQDAEPAFVRQGAEHQREIHQVIR